MATGRREPDVCMAESYLVSKPWASRTLVVVEDREASLVWTARHDAPDELGLAIQYFDHFAEELEFKRFHQSKKFAKLEQMIRRGRPPPKGLLSFEECLVDKVAAGAHRAFELVHAFTVEIIENHDDLEGTLGERDLLQIRTLPSDRRTTLARRDPGRFDLLRIRIDRDDVGAQARCGYGMPPAPARHIENLGTRTKQARVPREPSTRLNLN